MSVRTLLPFLALSFGVTWGIVALYILFKDPIESLFGEMAYTHPLFRLAVYSPGFAGIFLVWRHYGVSGLASYLRRLLMWRMPAAWWAFLLLGIPACFYLAAAVKGNLGDPNPISSLDHLILALIITLFIGPIEEFGWRGVALPLLQRRFAPLWAGLILGAIWALWHIPAFILDGTPQAAWSFGAFFVAVVAISVILTAMFNSARGSILIAALFHFQTNGPTWPDAQPWDALVFAIAAAVVVVIDRRALLTRDAAVVEVLMVAVKAGPTTSTSPPPGEPPVRSP
jgi:hypothetical protein